ncbi:minor tail protein [Mycobacterium phage SoilDragon]|uniref:Minor tail protein n=1 Tax=Mycobacterium phage SoilDragon TaxID=2590944 RepID=A0A516KUI1_9CAUD|nr:minor tail protein [Mycobacterium phage SoilDragon]QDP45333.1 minor tail protein [Mycobacterium phage SoilDragon]
MTTPNPNPNNGPGAELEGWLGTGAFEVGGGAWNYGQDFTEAAVREMFELPAITIFNALDLLEEQLLKMPLEALKIFEPLIPDVIEDDFADVASAVAKIIDTLTDGPAALLRGEFDEWLVSTFGSLATEVHQVLEILAGLTVTPINSVVQAVKDWYAALTGRISVIGNDGSINADIDKIPALQELVDAATNALSGASQLGTEVVGAGIGAAKATMENLFSMLTKTVRDVQALQSEQETTANGGKRYNIDFSTYPNGPFPTGLFNITYSGPGTSTLAISNGNAVWSPVNNGYRRATMLYPEPTLTPQQIVRGTLASAPQQGTNVRIWSIARANAAGTDYVFARGYCNGFLSYRGDIGCVKGGVEYIWASNVALTWNLDLRIVCGVGENPRRHQVYSGNTVVVDLIEPGDKQSIIDENHCYWGAITETDGVRVPGNVAGASVSDNAPPAVTGSTMRVYRSTTSGVSKSGGQSVLPANTLDAVDYRSEDIVWNAATQTATVQKAGTYVMGLRIQVGEAQGFSEERYPLIYINGVPRIKMGARRGISAAAFGVPHFPQDLAYGGDGVQYYLAAGATVQPGLSTRGSVNIVGDANASNSWFSMVRVG